MILQEYKQLVSILNHSGSATLAGSKGFLPGNLGHKWVIRVGVAQQGTNAEITKNT